MRILLVTLLLVTLLPDAVSAQTFSHLYAFGDSYSDNGRSRQLSRNLLRKKVKDAEEVPGKLYWQGRWSNGPVAVETLAELLRAPLTDYAVGGAKSGGGNYYRWMDPYVDTGVRGQVQQFLKDTAGDADPKALYFLFISANDFFEYLHDDEPEEALQPLADEAVEHQLEAVSRLADAGARHFLVVGSTDLSILPAMLQTRNQLPGKRFRDRVDAGLHQALPALAQARGLDIRLFDHSGFSQALRVEPDAQGLTELDAPCQPTWPKVKPVCPNPQAYYFWDEWHPTAKVHALAAQAMAELLAPAAAPER